MSIESLLETPVEETNEKNLPPVEEDNELKSCLGKEEVETIEREFQKNPKPTAQTKHQFAEDMGVDLVRINVS
jgi:hypothetical protein